MSNGRDKEVVDEEYYSSQPVSKSSKWVFPKWRRTSKNIGETSNNSENVPKNTLDNAPENPSENAPENPQEDALENQQHKRKWVFASEEAEKWSQDAFEFSHNGDAPFCYSRLFDHMKLDSDFWGTLLGNLCNRRLWPMHIEGWVTRMMRARCALLRRYGSSSVRWTILPPQIWEKVCHQETKLSAKYANGTDELFPPFWEVDYVYIPLYIKGTEDWLLVRIDMRTMEMLLYWSNNMYQTDYRGLIFLPTLDMFQWGFRRLLNEIKYWRKYNGPYIPERRRHQLTFVVNEDYLPKDGGGLDGDSGVLVCMLMQKLSQNKTVIIEPDFKETLYNFRLHMAEQFYKCRFAPSL